MEEGLYLTLKEKNYQNILFESKDTTVTMSNVNVNVNVNTKELTLAASSL